MATFSQYRFWRTVCLISFAIGIVYGANQSPNSVLLTKVKNLTLRKDKNTSARRVAAIPQLKCIGGSGKGYYDVDVMRCTNQGTSYDDHSVQWSCTASLPLELKLGTTDVVCEGYSSPNDPYILKGSCGVEYRLILTEAGEAKYGKPNQGWFGSEPKRIEGGPIAGFIFWTLLVLALCVILYGWYRTLTGQNRRRPLGRRTALFGGGGGGGGDDDDDPPPPYDYQPPKPRGPPRSRDSSWRYPSGRQPNRIGGNRGGWQPGFWTGALGGASAAWLAGRMGQRTNQPAARERSSDWPPAAGPSGSSRSSSSFSSGPSSPSSARYESTGFGETRGR